MRKKGCYHKNRPFRLLVAAALRFVQSYLNDIGIRRRVVKTRRVSIEWNDIYNMDACLNLEAASTKRVQALFSPLSFLLREKR